MVGQTSSVLSISASVAVKASDTNNNRHAILKAVYVTKAGAAGDKVEFKTGGSGGTVLLTVEGEAVQNLPIINTPFKDGIYATVTGTGARYLIVYE